MTPVLKRIKNNISKKLRLAENSLTKNNSH